MAVKLFLAALLLLAACGPPPAERAKAAALRMLAHERRPAIKPAANSLKVYDFSKAQVHYYSSDIPSYDTGHLVTYEAAAATTPAPPRRAVFVADNDSAFFFLPARHAAEFARQFGVRAPAPLPDSVAARPE